ncbi:MAG: AIR synthase-related protein, partial [Methanomicrobiaceae archaeon]|nr:AIR synthase-related protein [Methanomicrobiaceae archaeon]
QIGRGLNEGARQANIDLVGGETATLRGLVSGLDLAGTCLGIQWKDRVVTGGRIRPGDRIVGVPSSGIHSNGLTLARRIVEELASYDAIFTDKKTFGQELLTPTRIYAEALRVAAACPVHGMCHITGGGLLNLLRLGDVGFAVTDPLKVPPIFLWLQEAGGVADREMYRTFNMGMGYAFVVPETSVERTLAEMPDAQVVGEIVREKGVWVEGMEIR